MTGDLLNGDVDELARAAYAAYSEATGGLSHRGDQLPEWDDLGPALRNAWRAAASAVTDRVTPPELP